MLPVGIIYRKKNTGCGRILHESARPQHGSVSLRDPAESENIIFYFLKSILPNNLISSKVEITFTDIFPSSYLQILI